MATVEKEGVQNLRGSKSLLTSTNAVLKSGEIGFITDTDRMFVGDGTTQGKNRPVFLDSEKEAYIARLDGIYEGVDLTVKHATEIAASPYSGNAWAWIKARIQAHNFEGIHVGDYIPFQLAAGNVGSDYSVTAKTMNARIAGIDTYYQYGNTAVGHHIDFITDTTIGTNIPFNPTNNNNGTSDYQCPFLASKIYACLNGINNVSTGYNDVEHGYNASSGGVKQLLPEALRNVIISKKVYAEKRYSADGLLEHASGADWVDFAGLWLPTEQEVYGMPINSGGVKEANSGIDRALAGTPVQYPLYAGSAGQSSKKLKNRVSWWLSSVASGSSTRACDVTDYGYANALDCAITVIGVPVCFRVG